MKNTRPHHFNQHQILDMPSRYRAHFINSLSGFKSANLVGTINDKGQANVAIFSSVIHLGASPALVGFIMRPDSGDRHTLQNIQQTKQYTINQVGEAIWQSAHQTSARYLAEESEFEKTGLSPHYIDNCKAPFVSQSQLKYALSLQDIIPIPLNNTQLIIGEITDIICHKKCIKKDGFIDIETLNTIAISGLDSYHLTQRLTRLSYAKTDTTPVKISLDGETEAV
jgi:flavin reductase (DIM6/NTAB) family NADH-FMN oxidoreductase RutF